MRFQYLLWLVSLLIISACTTPIVKQGSPPQIDKKPKNSGYLLLFTEKRPNEPEAAVRMIITDKFLRMDEGPKSEDYILFNRKTKNIHNIVNEEQSILTIEPSESKTKPAFPLRWVIESQTSQAIMRTQDDKAAATHYLFNLNDKPCYNQVTVDNHLVEALGAMREYNQALANELKRNYRKAEGQQCYEAINLFDPNIRLQYGFPLREWGTDGYQRFLVNFKQNIIFPESLFVLPSGYKSIGL